MSSCHLFCPCLEGSQWHWAESVRPPRTDQQEPDEAAQKFTIRLDLQPRVPGRAVSFACGQEPSPICGFSAVGMGHQLFALLGKNQPRPHTACVGLVLCQSYSSPCFLFLALASWFLFVNVPGWPIPSETEALDVGGLGYVRMGHSKAL